MATSEGDTASTEGVTLAAKEDAVGSNHFAQLCPTKRRPGNTMKVVNGQQIGSRSSTSTGMSRRRLTKLLEEQMETDKQMQRVTEEAMGQTTFQNELNPIT